LSRSLGIVLRADRSAARPFAAMLGGGRKTAQRRRMFDLTTAVVIYCVLVAAVFVVMWLWYDRRDHRRFELERRKTTFHCIRCDALYTAPTGVELCRCPRCGHENARLRF
jgi:hypothetical protein